MSSRSYLTAGNSFVRIEGPKGIGVLAQAVCGWDLEVETAYPQTATHFFLFAKWFCCSFTSNHKRREHLRFQNKAQNIPFRPRLAVFQKNNKGVINGSTKQRRGVLLYPRFSYESLPGWPGSRSAISKRELLRNMIWQVIYLRNVHS
jgi:hypothetical protein